VTKKHLRIDYRVSKKPDGLEQFQTRRRKWAPVAEHLAKLSGTECFQWNVRGHTSNQIVAIKGGLRNALKLLKIDGELRHAIKDNVLFLWLDN